MEHLLINLIDARASLARFFFEKFYEVVRS